MYIHNLDPNIFEFGFFALKWYSMAYIVGIFVGWWLAKIILKYRLKVLNINFEIYKFDNLITYIIISIILGGRIGYVIFYNLSYYTDYPLDIIKIWEGGMSFHGAMFGVIVCTYIFAIKNNIKALLLLDIIACVSPIGLFFGRIANFISGELYGKPTDFFISVVFPQVDNKARHPSQLYEAILEGIILFIILNIIIFRKKIFTGVCSAMFLVFYGIFRIIAEQFREPDIQIGYILGNNSMGTLLSFLMILIGFFIYIKIKKNAF